MTNLNIKYIRTFVLTALLGLNILYATPYKVDIKIQR